MSGARLYGPVLPGDAQQGRIELHEGGVHRSMIAMARVAFGGRRDLRGRLIAREGEERPATREAPGVLDVDLHPHRLTALEFATLVDRALLGCAPHFHRQ